MRNTSNKLVVGLVAGYQPKRIAIRERQPLGASLSSRLTVRLRITGSCRRASRWLRRLAALGHQFQARASAHPAAPN